MFEFKQRHEPGKEIRLVPGSLHGDQGEQFEEKKKQAHKISYYFSVYWLRA
jgi:hypothetical protein